MGSSLDSTETMKSFLSLLLLVASSHGWVNDYDGHLFFECPQGETITRIESVHDNKHEDRVWGFECGPFMLGDTPANIDAMSWSGYVNSWDEHFTYECSSGAGVVAGLESEHDNHSEDRRWSFKCVSDSNSCYHDCHFTPFVNDYDEPMDYRVPAGYVITGVESVHNNHNEDRIWSFQLCQIKACKKTLEHMPLF